MSTRIRSLVGVAALALLVAACGGSSSAAPSSGATAAPTTAAATTPAETSPATSEAPTAAPTTEGSVPDITTGAAALADLDSYKMEVTMAMKGLDSNLFAAFGDGLTMRATVVLKPVKAADMFISMGAADQKLEMGYRVIDDKAWVNIGSWMESDAEDAESTMESFSPEKMFGGFSSVPGMTAAGDETRNGVETTHYRATGSDYTADMNEMVGLVNGTWAVDYWVARDGGYPVAYTVEGKGDNDTFFSMTFELSDINSPSNVVEAPTTGS